MKQYIRFGEPADTGKSTIYSSTAMIGEEEGVSVYEYDEINHKVILPQEKQELTDLTYKVLQLQMKINPSIHAYIVTGDELEIKGLDGEILLKNVRIIEDITKTINF